MKRKILLATVTMLLSAVTLRASADSNSAELHMVVVGIKPFEIIKEKYLGFGMILETEAGRKVIVTPDGKLGEGSTATMMSTASLPNQMTEALFGSFNEAVFRIKGGFNELFNGANEDYFNNALSVNVAEPSVDLKSFGYDNPVKCGTVSDFTTRFKPTDNNELVLHVGGTLTTEDLRGTGNHVCSGSTTITIVFNDDTISQNGGFGY